MNVGLGTFIRDGFTRATVEQAFRRLAAAVTAGFLVEHKDDGTHGDITVESISASEKDAAIAISTAHGSGDFTSRISIGEDGQIGILTDNIAGDGGSFYVGSDRQIDFFASSGASAANAQIINISNTANGTGAVNGNSVVIGRNSSGNGAAGYLVLVDKGNTAYVVWADDTGSLRIHTAAPTEDGSTVSDTAGNLVLQSNTSLYERSRTTAVGEWTTPSFNAANFTGSGTITWTVAAGDVTTFAYTLIGKTMIVQFFIETTSVSGTGTELRIAIPGGFTCAKSVNTPIRVADNGTFQFGYVRIAASATVMACFVDATGTTNWAGAADTTSVRGEVIFEVS